jgi:hypothetical protein
MARPEEELVTLGEAMERWINSSACQPASLAAAVDEDEIAQVEGPFDALRRAFQSSDKIAEVERYKRLSKRGR